MHQCFVWVLDEEVMMGKMAATSNLKQFIQSSESIYEIHESVIPWSALDLCCYRLYHYLHHCYCCYGYECTPSYCALGGPANHTGAVILPIAEYVFMGANDSWSPPLVTW